MYGSWAGAYGNFQFMPSTINNYAIDYNNDDLIDLKSTYFVSTIILLIPLLFFIIENKFISAFKDSSGITLS